MVKVSRPETFSRTLPILPKRIVQQRLKFAKDHVLRSKEKWRIVLWSDETKVNLFKSDRGMYSSNKKTEKYSPEP